MTTLAIAEGSTAGYLKWDGSYLGKFPTSWKGPNVRDYPISYSEIRIARFYQEPLVVDECTLVCRIHACNNAYACIVDEVSSLLGLGKIGTHTVKYGNILYTIYRLHTNQVRTLKDCIYLTQNPKIIQRVQDVFVFRMVMGLSCNFQSSIYIDDNNLPISYRNKLETRADISPVLPNSIIIDWFVDDIEDSITRITGGEDNLGHIRCAVQDIIKRADKELIWLDCLIYNRLTGLC